MKKELLVAAICGDELKNLFDNKGNLWDLIERKAREIMMEAKTDLIKAGLYKS